MQPLPQSITFTVDNVKPSEDRLDECYAYEGLVELAGREAIACSGYTDMVVKDVKYNSLVYAVHLAYAGHRPLVISPDMVWLAIAQGIKQHILLYAEELRTKFVSHSDREKISVDLPKGFLPDSPYAEWEHVIAEFGEIILERIHPEKRTLLTGNFSTTGSREYTAYLVNMMNAFQRYFDYEARAICGIPRITLEGMPADWEQILEKTSQLDNLGLGWWREHLDPVLLQFLRTSRGDVDQDHWRSIYKIWERYGNDKLTGWIINLFPYLRDKTTGRHYRNSEMGRETHLPEKPEGFKAIDPGLKLDEFPLGLASAPITITEREAGEEQKRKIEISAGFTGIRQIGNDGALKPIIGWAVHNQSALRRLLEEIDTAHTALPFRERTEDYATAFPGELSELYDRFDRAFLFKRPFSRGTRIRPRSPRNSFYYLQFGIRRIILNPFGIYTRLADKLELSRIPFLEKIGGMLQEPLSEKLLELYCIIDLPGKKHVAFICDRRGEWRYVLFRRGRQGPRLPVIAKSLEELLTQLLLSPKPDFPDHGYYELVQQEKGWWDMEYRESS